MFASKVGIHKVRFSISDLGRYQMISSFSVGFETGPRCAVRYRTVDLHKALL